jgi:hypothetical protein
MALLIAMGYGEYIGQLKEAIQPTDSWSRTYCRQFAINICKPQTLKLARRMAYKVPVIMNFVSPVQLLLNRDPRLILDMDRTSVNARNLFKALTTPQDGQPNAPIPLPMQI